MANIAFLHNALGKTDGVSLEINKWRTCLEDFGHKVFYCAGNDDVPGIFCIPELSFFHPETNKILKNATVALVDYTEPALEAAINAQKAVIKTKLMAFIRDNKIGVLVPNNLMSVGYHLPALIALSEVIEETGLPTISHNHDFYFEDSGEVNPTCAVAQRILDTYSPAAFPNVQNLVINRLAQKQLKDRKNVDARVVPNVFDFKQPPWHVDDFNADFRKSLGLNGNDLVFLQATRVMNRKGIELAIDIVGEVGSAENRARLAGKPLYDGRRFSASDRIVLLCAGHIEEFGSTGDYHSNLMERAKRQNVDIRFVGKNVKHARGTTDEGKIYSLWDSYVHADFVTYPSLWEGWGNQLIEAIFAKLPVVLFEYPVFTSDLKTDGLDVVSLGTKTSGTDDLGLVTVDPGVLKRVGDEVVGILLNGARRQEMVEHNFALADEKYSLQVLSKIISELLDEAGI